MTIRTEAKKKWQKTNPHERERRRIANAANMASQLPRKFGMSVEDYYDMLNRQNGACAICRAKPKASRRLSVDHDHATGTVRGLLCHNCNVMLGLARDTTDILLRAVRYLLFS